MSRKACGPFLLNELTGVQSLAATDKQLHYLEMVFMKHTAVLCHYALGEATCMNIGSRKE